MTAAPSTTDLLEPFDTLLVARLARLAGESDASRMRILAHAVRAVREAHPCLTPELHARTVAVPLAEAESAFGALASSPLVARAARDAKQAPPDRPFVLDDASRLYVARYFDHERALARGLVELARGEPGIGGDPSAALVDALFPPGGANEAQRDAALHACASAFTIVSGGPGTGKTSTVVKMLALLADGAIRGRAKPPTVLLMAPTGKAATRLTESIRAALENLPLEPTVRGAITTAASTIHRALSVQRGGGFRRNREKPLEADVVIVDEASMVDLALMRALVDAVPPGARLVLLGDRDQLASVEAGSVLSDLCLAAQTKGSPIEGSLRELATSHRFSDASGIGALAKAIREQRADDALAILRDDGWPDANLGEPVGASARIPRSLQIAARDGYMPLLGKTPAESLRALGLYRVLTAHRRGVVGVQQLGKRIAGSFGRGAGEHALGTPILVLENDPETGLSNGDVGVVVSAALGTAQAHVAFPADEDVRVLGTGRLPSHEPCWAMSIHKSQGSEFDHVSVVLPDASAIASRELLYTAVTRAKKRVDVHATEAAIRACIERSVVRASGLADAILALS